MGPADLAGNEGILLFTRCRTSEGLWRPPLRLPQAKGDHWEARKCSDRDSNEGDSNKHEHKHLYHCFNICTTAL